MDSRSWAVVALAALVVVVAVASVVLVPWRVPTPSRATQAAALRDIPAGVVAKGRELHAALRPSTYAGLLVGLVAPLLLGLTPAGSDIVAAVAQPFGGHWLVEAVLGGLAVLAILWLVSLPFAAWRHTVLRRYGLSTQAWRAWTVDLLKGGAVGLVIGALLLAGFYTLAHVSPDWWWAFGAVAAAALVVLLSFVFPVLVEPIFNRFSPMPAGPLRDDLLAMAARDQLPVRDVLVADASRRTTGLNAYVSGFGATRRIVVYDTLLREGSPGEVRSVVAHELGHATDRDPEVGTLLGAVGSAAAVVALYLVGQWDALLALAGVSSISSPRAIGLVLAIAAVSGFVTAPFQNVVSRRIEARADQHALGLTGDRAEFAAMQLRLATVNLADVHPPRVEYVLFGTHPDTVERLAAAREAGPPREPAPSRRSAREGEGEARDVGHPDLVEGHVGDEQRDDGVHDDADDGAPPGPLSASPDAQYHPGHRRGGQQQPPDDGGDPSAHAVREEEEVAFPEPEHREHDVEPDERG